MFYRFQEKAKACSKLETLVEFKKCLDEESGFKVKVNEIIRSNGARSTLLRLLNLVPEKPPNLSISLLNKFVTYYKQVNPTLDFYCFQVCGKNMNVTLEDVLFLTNLPIIGRPVVPFNNRDKGAVQRVFSYSSNTGKMSLGDLRKI